MPQTHHKAAEFVTRLSSMVAVGQVDNLTDTTSPAVGAGPGIEEDEGILDAQPSTAVTNNSDKKDSTTGISPSKLIREATWSVPVQPKDDGLARVSALDGSGSISSTSKIKVLLVYFMFNLGLTFYNKAVMIMVKVSLSIPYPMSIAYGAFSFRSLSY